MREATSRRLFIISPGLQLVTTTCAFFLRLKFIFCCRLHEDVRFCICKFEVFLQLRCRIGDDVRFCICKFEVFSATLQVTERATRPFSRDL